METCVLCRNKFEVAEGEEPAVLFVNKYGIKRVLCAECEAKLDAATAEEDSDEKQAAYTEVMALADNMKDPDAMEVLREVLSGESSPEETEEDKAAEQMWEESRDDTPEVPEKKATFWDYLPAIILGCACVGLILYMFLR